MEIKGLFTDFTKEVHVIVYSSGMLFTLSNFFHPCGRTVDFMVFRRCPIWPNSKGNGVVGPNRYTKKPTVAATEIGKIKTLNVNRMSELETVPWTPPICKLR